MFHPFFLVFWVVISGQLTPHVYKEQGHILGFPTKASCQAAATRIETILRTGDKVQGVDYVMICAQDEGVEYSGGGEYEEEWNTHRYDYSA